MIFFESPTVLSKDSFLKSIDRPTKQPTKQLSLLGYSFYEASQYAKSFKQTISCMAVWTILLEVEY